MTKHTPATPLPWSEPVNYGNVSYEIIGSDRTALIGKKWTVQDARYVAHACNAYPRLVEALRNVANEADAAYRARTVRALLAELGE